MNINFNSDKPIFAQLAEQLEDAILSGAFKEESQLPSVAEISCGLKINPATANKGVNQLTESGVAYKKRGMGIFVSAGSVEMLKRKRKDAFFESYVLPLTDEAKRLDISESETLSMVERGFKHD